MAQRELAETPAGGVQIVGDLLDAQTQVVSDAGI
jgi:hypothetical protein